MPNNYTPPGFTGDDYEDDEALQTLTPAQIAARDAEWPEFAGADEQWPNLFDAEEMTPTMPLAA